MYKKILLLLIVLILSATAGCTCNVSEGYVYYDCYGNLIPCTDLTYNLGSPLARWHNLYVENITGVTIGTGNVTAIPGGSAGYIPYFSSATNLVNSGLFWDIITSRLGINDITPSTALDVTGTIHVTQDINSDQDVNAGNDVNVTNDLDVGDDANITGTLTTNNPHLNEAVAMTVTSTNLNLVDDANFITTLLERGAFTPIANLYVRTVAGSGYGWTEGALKLFLATGATASSYSLADASGIGHQHSRINWDKDVIFIFRLSRGNSDSQAIARVQIKEAMTEGILATKGIGLQIDNFALTGESYGTSRGTVDLSTNLTNGTVVEIKIVKTSSKVEFFVDGASKGSITTSANIPSGFDWTSDSANFCSIKNGAAGGVDATLIFGSAWLWYVK